MKPTASPSLRQWQTKTLFSLLIGYAGYYFCRSNLSIVAPLLLREFGGHGLTREGLGLLASVGTLFYVLGASVSGPLCDLVGGRRMFLLGMAASVGCTVLFGFGTGMGVFLFAWSINRIFQSTGWTALVKLASHWFPYDRYGSVMGILSLSFLFGDAVARLFLGELVRLGVSWRGVFFASAAVLAAITVFCTETLRESPAAVGEEPVAANPKNLFAEELGTHPPENLKALLAPFFQSPSFWVILLLSPGLCLIREAFGLWTPTYLSEIGHFSPGAAGEWSLLFPFFGGISVLIGGPLSDRLFKGRRGGFLTASLALAAASLLAMSRWGTSGPPFLSLAFISAVPLFLMTPLTFLTGAVALDFGGQRGSSTAAGLINSAGYLGGILSGAGVGKLVERGGWGLAFGVMAGIAAFSTGMAALYWRLHEQADEG